MKKINKQLYLRMILPTILMITGFAVIFIMALTQPEKGGHPTYITVLGIIGFIVPLIGALVLLIRLYGKSMFIAMLSKELKELKHTKDYYSGSITASTSKGYLDIIAEDLTNAKYKDLTSEVNMSYNNYRFLMRKHFWTLDSTNIHIHLATLDTDISKTKDFFDEITNKELELDYGKYKGSNCAIIAICFVDNFLEDEKLLSFFSEAVFVRGIAIVKVLVDISQNRVFISRGGAITGNRGKQIVKRFVLRAKSLRKHPGCIERNNEKIKELEEKLGNMDYNSMFSDAELSSEQKTYAHSLRNYEVVFQRNATVEEGGIIFYKEDDKILYLFCDYDESDKTFGIYNIKRMQWSIPKKIRINQKQKQEITEKIVKYLNKNNIPYNFVDMFFSTQNQTVLVSRVKK